MRKAARDLGRLVPAQASSYPDPRLDLALSVPCLPATSQLLLHRARPRAHSFRPNRGFLPRGCYYRGACGLQFPPLLHALIAPGLRASASSATCLSREKKEGSMLHEQWLANEQQGTAACRTSPRSCHPAPGTWSPFRPDRRLRLTGPIPYEFLGFRTRTPRGRRR